ncbi:hypothetical protein Q0Z83_082820 [Actinoplanes sichuanensis]|uniref:DUF3152 domain-containing protein n=1 Tax=Actinoplanes sichuanensis TaxID=512349 RepID=A0ABW4ADR9_9ACTN|nr:DUF3152 domain-containing protein [Actinoplanes sichuanensis]BEL10091.1 hypothetical protein Q0Z83_082820 [Actinoplanes sichuanensis]
MANATNGPVDPDAGTDRRGRAARSRAEAEQPPADEKPARRRTVAASTATTRSPLTAPAEPARKSIRRSPATERPSTATERPSTGTERRSTGTETGRKSGEPPVKSTSSRTATGRAPARKTATAPIEPPLPAEEKPPRRRRAAPSSEAQLSVEQTPARRRTAPSSEAQLSVEQTPARRRSTPTPIEPPPPAEEKPARRRSTAKARPQSEPPTPALSEPQSHAVPPPLTRGILELAAERVAASRPRPAEPEPPIPADDDPMAAPGAYLNPRATAPRRTRATARRTETTPSADNGWLGAPAEHAVPHRVESEPDPEPPAVFLPGTSPDEQYPRTMNRGLPPSVRLPAELPDNLWPPKSLLERNLAENIHVPATVPPRVEDPWEAEEPEPPEAVADEHLYVVPPDRNRSTVEIHRQVEAEPEFLPSVLEHPEPENEYVPAHSRAAGSARHAVTETAAGRRVRRRRRAVLVAYLLLVILVLIVGHELRDDERPLAPGKEAAQRADEPAGVGPAAGPVPQATGDVPAKTDADGGGESAGKGKAGEFGYAQERGPMLGDGGRLYRFRVAVEKNVDDTSPTGFAEAIDETLGDERSWINDGRLRLRRVPKSSDADFTIYLASAKTSEKMCATGGLDTEGYTSCRVPGQVIINADRWADAVPEYDGKLDTYRRYTINHEVGHELGHGHEACPGEGEKAPVMQQQTFGLKGCTPNAWPYLDGERYAGKPIA